MTRKTREIHTCSYSVDTRLDPKLDGDPDTTWLLRHAQQHGLTTLLAHTDNGVVWGKVENSQLKLSGQAFADLPQLELATLQQLRLFGERGELFVWRDGPQWRARLLTDNLQHQDTRYFDEPHLQWGDHSEAEANGFTLVAEGQQGLRHAVPLPADRIPFDPPQRRRDRWHPLRLTVRHYLAEQDDGRLVIAHSRLTGLTAMSAPKEA